MSAISSFLAFFVHIGLALSVRLPHPQRSSVNIFLGLRTGPPHRFCLLNRLALILLLTVLCTSFSPQLPINRVSLEG